MTHNNPQDSYYTLHAYTMDGTVTRTIDLGFWATEDAAIEAAGSELSKLPDGVRATLYLETEDDTFVARVFDGNDWIEG